MENSLPNTKPSEQEKALKKLEVFIGHWHAEGQSYAKGQQKEKPYASALPWISDERYDWLPGNFFILHTWDAKIGEESFIGTEVIGYDEEEGGYFTHFFDNSGFHPKYIAKVDADVWTFTSFSSRAKVIVADDSNRMTFNWEWRSESNDWLPLCNRVATRIG